MDFVTKHGQMTFSNVILRVGPLVVFKLCSDTKRVRMSWTDDHSVSIDEAKTIRCGVGALLPLSTCESTAATASTLPFSLDLSFSLHPRTTQQILMSNL
jgi:hypothetical protein